MDVMDTWLCELKPVCTEELLGDNSKLQRIDQWVSDTNKLPLLLMGPTGSSKTTSVVIHLKKYGYTPNIIHMSDFSTTNELNNRVFDLLSNRDATSFFSSAPSPIKNAVIIDDFECASVYHKSFCKLLMNFSTQSPIVFITNTKHHNLVEFVKRNSVFVEFGQLEYDDLWQWCLSTCQVKNIRLSNKLIQNIIEASTSDINQLILWMYQVHQFLLQGKKTAAIRRIILSCQRKQKNEGLIEAVRDINMNMVQASDAEIVYDMDRILLPRMVHENIYRNRKNIHKIHKAARLFSMYDVCYNYIHSPPHSESLHDICGTLSCWGASRCLDTSKTYELTHENVKFPKLMTIRYQTFVNYNNLRNLPYCISIARRHMIYWGDLLRGYVLTNNINDVVEFVKHTGLNPKHIDNILKLSSLHLKKTVRYSNQKQIQLCKELLG